MPNNKIRILVVDDNKNFTEILCDYIDYCYSSEIEIVGIAFNGLEAIKLITSEQPDIVILDIIMPFLDGIGVLKQINSMNMKRKPLFIMLSAVGQNRIIKEALDLHAIYYVEKPFDMDILISKIINLKPSICKN